MPILTEIKWLFIFHSHLKREKEAHELVTSANMLNPSNDEPIVSPTQDMTLCYLTRELAGSFTGKAHGSYDEACRLYEWRHRIILIFVSVEGSTLPTFTTYGRCFTMPFLMDTRFPERDHEQNNLQF
jgi:hypothetical protein